MNYDVRIMNGELNQFLKKYEFATNTHDFSNVAPLLYEKAIYWFSDGSFIGIDAIRQAFTETWGKIQNEQYQIRNIEWIGAEEKLAVCTYEFEWKGEVNGKKLSGIGRGTNVIGKIGNKWKMLHEHLSKSIKP